MLAVAVAVAVVVVVVGSNGQLRMTPLNDNYAYIPNQKSSATSSVFQGLSQSLLVDIQKICSNLIRDVAGFVVHVSQLSCPYAIAYIYCKSWALI